MPAPKTYTWPRPLDWAVNPSSKNWSHCEPGASGADPRLPCECAALVPIERCRMILDCEKKARPNQERIRGHSKDGLKCREISPSALLCMGFNENAFPHCLQIHFLENLHPNSIVLVFKTQGRQV